MSDVLRVSACQVSHPIARLVPMKAYDRLLHRPE